MQPPDAIVADAHAFGQIRVQQTASDLHPEAVVTAKDVADSGNENHGLH
jgi:hypothetical protein